MDSATGDQGWPGVRHKSFLRTFLSQCFDQSMFPKGNIGNPVPPTFAGPPDRRLVTSSIGGVPVVVR